MTIKELEQILEVPRATVRYYEKEGLINPQRESNGYRDYSNEDIEKLKKIIIFRKIGISVNEIEDIFDGAKSVNEVLDENIKNLQNQIDELAGAMNLSRKIQENKEDILSFNTDTYWNYVDEEEKKGNRFFDIAKDLINEEKKTLFNLFFNKVDDEGKPYSLFDNITWTIITILFIGVLDCDGRKMNIKNIFLGGISSVAGVIIIVCIWTVPLFFLGKKWTWIRERKNLAIKIPCILSAVVCIVLIIVLFCGSVFGIL
ncbi:MAG: MerR family transcriptional regulator [Lachnospiraceae bacterium]|nr:MerR family transcriptional regulator [Lachnospiraceae bacterium]